MCLKKVSFGLFSKVFSLKCGNDCLYLKFFNYPKNFFLNGYDLSKVFDRDRLYVSTTIQKIFFENSHVRTYCSQETWSIKQLGLMITRETYQKSENLQQAILSSSLDTLSYLEKTLDLSRNLLKAEKLFSRKTLENINNEEVLNLKLDLQFIKPLCRLLPVSEVEQMTKQLGLFNYLAQGDLQPKNIIFFSNGQMRIVDFEEGFWGPRGWDIGFLWGNLFYLCANCSREIKQKAKLFFEQLVSETNGSLRLNVLYITASIILMRVYFFPLIDISLQEKRRLSLLTGKLIGEKWINI